MKFLDREYEMQVLAPLLKRKKPAFVVMYGRRRCGKSTLINRVLKKGDVYFQADRQEPAIQREQLVGAVAASLNVPYEAGFRTWESLLIDLNRFLKPGKTLALDEFPYLLKNEPALPSILQRLIDGGKLKYNLLISGSSQNAMSEMVRNGREPLYGRADAFLHIRPLKAGWIMDGLKLSPENAIREYAVWGGVPRYWELRCGHKNLESALESLVFGRDSMLLDEPLRLLLDDLRSAVQPYTLLTLIGQGVHRPSEISGRLGKSLPSLADSFQKLIELGFIRREIPFGESIRSSKRTLYKIDDPFLAFYFRFVLPNKQRIDMGFGKQALAGVMQKLDEHVAGEWENLCRMAVPHLSIGNTVWDMAHRWWGPGTDGQITEIDVAAHSVDKKKILIGEAKWSGKAESGNSMRQLNVNSNTIRGLSDAEPVKVLFTRQKKAEIEGVFQVLPEDVLNALR